MIVSWKWLQDYVQLDMNPAEVAHRLAMSGLNHEGSETVVDDLAIDLEVTSNRPDCLGHIGVAREIGVLWQRPLNVPEPALRESGSPVSELAQVIVETPKLCPRYTARVIRGVKVGPSPDWLTSRLRTIGVAAINNVVDVTNYVLMECGQPLHAFDFAMLAGGKIVVREASKGEKFEAIDHHTYELQPGMCVIADDQRAIALGGVMGGADSEVSEATGDVLVEAAEFAPISIRSTARSLNLHSPSSYRFERGVDPEGVDWASRRCCELILDVAGGELCEGVIDVGGEVSPRSPVALRLGQLPRILGIDIPAADVRRILLDLGCQEVSRDERTIEVIPPSWRRDITREIDLVEEAARIYGYDKIPEDVNVPMAPSYRSHEDRVLAKVRTVLAATGFDEALTNSVVPTEWSDAFSPWSDEPPLLSNTPIMKGADRLRRSLLPSLLDARRLNETLANPLIELFEMARVYLTHGTDRPTEQLTLGIVSDGDYSSLKGVVETIIKELKCDATLHVEATAQSLLDVDKSCTLRLDGDVLGHLGELDAAGRKLFSLRAPAVAAELRLDGLIARANLVPQHTDQSPFPAMTRDLNIIVDEQTVWADLAGVVRKTGGPCLESVQFREVYRDVKTDGANTKRLLFSIALRAPDRTLTNDEGDQIRSDIVAAVSEQCGGRLLGENG